MKKKIDANAPNIDSCQLDNANDSAFNMLDAMIKPMAFTALLLCSIVCVFSIINFILNLPLNHIQSHYHHSPYNIKELNNVIDTNFHKADQHWYSSNHEGNEQSPNQDLKKQDD
jgi:hypothetical protein